METILVIKTFAQVREVSGEGELEFSLDAHKTIADVLLSLKAKNEKWALALDGTVICAKNQQLCTPDTPIAAGDEVAFFPPVTGG